MTKNSNMGPIRPGDLAEALGLLTRLPVHTDGGRGARAAWAWPLAGGVVALLAVVVGWAMLAMGVPGGIVAATVIAVQIVATGALHEDGLADCADGFWGGYDAERRLEIMKDSHVGTYGILALILTVLARWGAVAHLIAADWLFGGLIVAAVVSRVPMVALMCWIEPARSSGLSRAVGRPDQDMVVIAALVAGVVGLICAGFAALPIAVVVAALGYGVARLAMAKIGGQTGDVLGASQQICEIGALTVLAALA